MRDFCAMVLLQFVHSFFSLFVILLSINIISSWFVDLQEFPIIKYVKACTDPYLNFFRSFIPPLGPLDLSPIVAFFALQFIEIWVKRLIIMVFA